MMWFRCKKNDEKSPSAEEHNTAASEPLTEQEKYRHLLIDISSDIQAAIDELEYASHCGDTHYAALVLRQALHKCCRAI